MTRRAVHAYLSEDAADGWQDFANRAGVSMTGLLEVLGADLAGEGDDELENGRRSWVVRARRVDADRRRRHGRRSVSQ